MFSENRLSKQKICNIRVQYESLAYDSLKIIISNTLDRSLIANQVISNNKEHFVSVGEKIDGFTIQVYTEDSCQEIGSYRFCREELLEGEDVLEQNQFYCRVAKEEEGIYLIIFDLIYEKRKFQKKNMHTSMLNLILVSQLAKKNLQKLQINCIKHYLQMQQNSLTVSKKEILQILSMKKLFPKRSKRLSTSQNCKYSKRSSMQNALLINREMNHYKNSRKKSFGIKKHKKQDILTKKQDIVKKKASKQKIKTDNQKFLQYKVNKNEGQILRKDNNSKKKRYGLRYRIKAQEKQTVNENFGDQQNKTQQKKLQEKNKKKEKQRIINKQKSILKYMRNNVHDNSASLRAMQHKTIQKLIKILSKSQIRPKFDDLQTQIIGKKQQKFIIKQNGKNNLVKGKSKFFSLTQNEKQFLKDRQEKQKINQLYPPYLKNVWEYFVKK